LLLLMSLLWASYSEKTNDNTDVDQGRLTEIHGIVHTDSNAPPIIVAITDKNLAKRVKAGEPHEVHNPLNHGMGTPKFTNFGTDHGLAIKNAIVIYKDQEGNLWIGTQNAEFIIQLPKYTS